MNKYEKFNSYSDVDDFVLNDGESILFDLRPKKSAYIFNIVISMLPFIIYWLILDIIFICAIFMNNSLNISLLYVPFFIVHLMPVWYWVYRIFKSSKRWVNTRYIITDSRVVIKNGFISRYRTILYKDIANVFVNIGFFDRFLGVGDIRLDVMGSISDGSGDTTLLDIINCQDVYNKLSGLIHDEQSNYSDNEEDNN